MLERILGLPLRVQAFGTCVAEAEADVTQFYEQPADPSAAAPTGTILVVHADGQGVPRVQASTQRAPGRLGKEQKRGTKQEAVVTGLDTLAPYPRTPPEIGDALLQEPRRPEPAPRPRPEGKELRATWEGKAVARRRVPQRVAQREGPHIATDKGYDVKTLRQRLRQRGTRAQIPKRVWKTKKTRGRPIKKTVPRFQAEKMSPSMAPHENSHAT